MDASTDFDVPTVGADRVVLRDDPGPTDNGPSDFDGGESGIRDGQSPTDSGAPDVPDPTTLDVPALDAAFAPQPCAFVAAPVAFGSGGRGSRPVYMQSDATGFAVGTHIVRDGAENVWIQRISRAGAPTASGNISNLPMGRTARGGSSVREGMFLFATWSQSEGMSELVYVKRTLDNFFEFPMGTQQLTMSGQHREPQIASTLRGQIISWKSVVGARTQLSSVSVQGGSIGAQRTLTDASEDVGSFRLVATNIGGVQGVVYRDNSMATPRVRYRALLEDGSTSGVVMDVATGADLGAVVDATINDAGTVWVVWMQGNALKLRQIAGGSINSDAGADASVDAGVMLSATVDLANTARGEDPAIAMDGTELVVAFRDLSSLPGTLVLLRLRTDGSQRDRSLMASCVAGGRLAVATQGDSYGIGWVDDLDTGAVARVGAARCR